MFKSLKKSNKKIVRQYLKQGMTRKKLIKALDRLVSDEVKRRAKGKCVKCGLVKKNAGVSHYFSRRYIGTRWNFDNLDWACWGDHYHKLERDKTPGSWYHAYMIKKLGNKKFDLLEIRAYAINKFPTSDLQVLCEVFKKGKFI